jgi:hypothetical protein
MKGIDKQTRDFVYFLLESRSKEWLEFQHECLDNILSHYGEFLRSSKRSKVVEFPLGAADYVPEGIKQTDFCKTVFLKLFEIISEIRAESPTAEITIDITAAPRMIVFIIAFVAMVLSTKKSRVKLQMIPKGFPADPKYYVPDSSAYFKKHIAGKDPISEMMLATFRKIEKEDEGGPDIAIELPMVEVPLLFSRSEKSDDKTAALLVLFQRIPERDKPMKSSKDMLTEMADKEKQIIHKMLKSQAIKMPKRQEEKTKMHGVGKGKINEKETEARRIERIWVSKNLSELEDLGLVELEKRGKYFYARRTWAGDLISGVVEEQYNSLMHRQR